MKNTVETQTSYKCMWCGKLYGEEHRADDCAFSHATVKL